MNINITVCNKCGRICIIGKCHFAYDTEDFIDFAGDTDQHGFRFNLCPHCVYVLLNNIIGNTITSNSIKDHCKRLNIKLEEY